MQEESAIIEETTNLKLHLGGARGQNVLDPLELSNSRAIIQASSGGGKSFLLRLIVEKVAERMPVIVIDPEGEFHTVREVCSMVLVGPSGDLRADVASAAKVGRGLREQSCSAIVDLSELPTKEHDLYVEQFIAAIMHAPRKYWSPTLICIDEAHRYCPESGRDTRAAGEIIDLMSRGRKRRLGGVLLTQRISKLRKDAIAEAGNQFFGRTSLDIDLKRSADMLGVSARSDEAQALRSFKSGEWYAHGPALSGSGVHHFRASLPKTSPPDPKSRTVAPVKNAKVIAAIAETVEQALKENLAPVTLEEAENVIKHLRREMASLNKQKHSGLSPADLERARARGKSEFASELKSHMLSAATILGAQISNAQRILDGMKLDSSPPFVAAMAEIDLSIGSTESSLGEFIKNTPQTFDSPGDRLRESLASFTNNTRSMGASVMQRVKEIEPEIELLSRGREMPSENIKLAKIGGGANGRVLRALAWWYAVGVTHPTNSQLAFIADLSPKASTIRGARSALKKIGLIEYDAGFSTLTAKGLEAAPEIKTATTPEEWQRRIRNRLGGVSLRAFDALLNWNRNPMSVDDLCQQCGVSPTASTIRGALSRLRTLGLIEKGQPIRLTDLVYPPELE